MSNDKRGETPQQEIGPESESGEARPQQADTPRKRLGLPPAAAVERGGERVERPALRARFKPDGLKPVRGAQGEGRAEREGKEGRAGREERTGREGWGAAAKVAPARDRKPAPARERAGTAERTGSGPRNARGAASQGDKPAWAGRQRSDSGFAKTGRPERGRPAVAGGEVTPTPDVRPSRPALPPRQPRPVPNEAREAVEGGRLSKVMAERGLCSRREADQIIERGWVFVDGVRVSELGVRVSPDARVELAPEAQARQARQVTILLHKPVGYVSGQPEPGYEPAVSLIGPDNQFDRDTAQRFHSSHLRGLAPAGRLDIDSTGLLVLTQNGRIARQLIGEDSRTDKEYLVRVEGELIENGLELLNHGLSLDGRALRPAEVSWINDDQLHFVLREGRKRQIRRMCELVGLKVVGLKRVRIGRVRLGDLPLGQWRFLREDERF